MRLAGPTSACAAEAASPLARTVPPSRVSFNGNVTVDFKLKLPPGPEG
jgi:hypothetical protein